MKVRCENCTKYEEGKCIAKGNIKTAPAKPRKCTKYVESAVRTALREYKHQQALENIPLYKPTHRYYSGVDGAKFILSNPKSASRPKN